MNLSKCSDFRSRILSKTEPIYRDMVAGIALLKTGSQNHVPNAHNEQIYGCIVNLDMETSTPLTELYIPDCLIT